MFRPTKKAVSEEGVAFTPETPVTFVHDGEVESGTVFKQLTNSAIIEIDETEDNDDLMFQSEGRLVVSYDDLHIKKD
ncbi:hypothetical protein K5X77_02480 [Vagococcus lutrae]|uniref:hypothetical protein n=1 Tax=Vagococcus lutrae TaxID=81947 RepID=UPI001C979396|nr:hypothetical protein [Vagococcus lutrae]MDY3706576.1 hypothetical protein [Vagococcus lutrae]QZN89181.1 hypothetical protein K5X77_02480 [Vagococcus lutrae]